MSNSSTCDPDSRDSCNDSDETVIAKEQVLEVYKKPNNTPERFTYIVDKPDVIVFDKSNVSVFRLIFRVDKFYPDTVTVTYDGRTATLECKQSQMLVAGCWLSTVIVRKFQIPKIVDMQSLETTISKNYTIRVAGAIKPQFYRLGGLLALNTQLHEQIMKDPKNLLTNRIQEMQNAAGLIKPAYNNYGPPGYGQWNPGQDRQIDSRADYRPQTQCESRSSSSSETSESDSFSSDSSSFENMDPRAHAYLQQGRFCGSGCYYTMPYAQ